MSEEKALTSDFIIIPKAEYAQLQSVQAELSTLTRQRDAAQELWNQDMTMVESQHQLVAELKAELAQLRNTYNDCFESHAIRGLTIGRLEMELTQLRERETALREALQRATVAICDNECATRFNDPSVHSGPCREARAALVQPEKPK